MVFNSLLYKGSGGDAKFFAVSVTMSSIITPSARICQAEFCGRIYSHRPLFRLAELGQHGQEAQKTVLGALALPEIIKRILTTKDSSNQRFADTKEGTK
jgi:hypothetical protein